MQANNPDKRLTFLEMIIYDNDWLILFDKRHGCYFVSIVSVNVASEVNNLRSCLWAL
jgi:hypothetical protein